MALRFLLVTLVAGMGLELPSRDDASQWVDQGRAWVAARMDDWSVTTAKRAEEAKDRAFRAIVQDMSRKFAADNQRTELARLEALKSKTAPVVAFEPILVEDEFEPIPVADSFQLDVVETLIRAALSADDRIEVADVVAPAEEAPVVLAGALTSEFEADLAVDAPAEPAAPTAVAAATETEAERTDRLSAAVRLTREAFVAWASVLTSPGEIAQR